MTPLEAQKRLKAFRARVGGNSDVFVCVESADAPLSAAVYPDGVGRNCALRVKGVTFESLFEQLDAQWDEYAAKHRASKLRRMALRIIEATAERGQCDDMLLRDAGFTQSEITALGEEACAEADRMASNGPFKITRMVGSNAA